MTHAFRLYIVAFVLLIAQTSHAQPATFYRYFWSDDGSRFIVGVQNGDSFLVTVYDESWQPLATRPLPCCSLSVSPDGRSLLINSSPSEILDIDTLQTLRTLSNTIGYAGWSPDGKELAAFTSGPPGVLNIYSAVDGQLLRSFDNSDAAPWDWPLGPSRSPDGTLFVTGVGSQLAFLDAHTGGQVGQTLTVDGFINIYRWSSDSRQVAVSLTTEVPMEMPGSFPTGDSAGNHYINSLVIVDVITGSIRNLKSGFRYPASSLVWSPDDSQIATYLDVSLTILNSATGDIISNMLPTFISIIIGYSPLGGRLLIGWPTDQPFDSPVYDLEITSSTVELQSVQTALDGLIQIVVPLPTLDRFAEIAASCGAPTALTTLDTSRQAESEARRLEAQLDALPEGTIPPGCEADLRAIAEAIQAQGE